ncbi:hypothetical protein NUU61_006606 [Penicillium alfredii]|uniref:Glucose-methanol-choline oxidoreductase N-terminal domain-containing protein n=1 Tax=Penicillium alfredii TaxID=1506179 RepID=A0A9W9F1F6_9EURO|nr:uncharacterized protein NUU61_006606 [Penicillium alfredii]KAJ5091736.1 hypothetical protein NUU61_006606 [Penicillium alfredii]
MFLRRFLGLAALLASSVTAVELTGYEYVVVGSGAGGSPLAARLALAGHKTLLIEAGDDQGKNTNCTVPAFSVKASEDERCRQARDYKTTYETPAGTEYT